jgi:hypothetical protein
MALMVAGPLAPGNGPATDSTTNYKSMTSGIFSLHSPAFARWHAE